MDEFNRYLIITEHLKKYCDLVIIFHFIIKKTNPLIPTTHFVIESPNRIVVRLMIIFYKKANIKCQVINSYTYLYDKLIFEMSLVIHRDNEPGRRLKPLHKFFIESLIGVIILKNSKALVDVF